MLELWRINSGNFCSSAVRTYAYSNSQWRSHRGHWGICLQNATKCLTLSSATQNSAKLHQSTLFFYARKSGKFLGRSTAPPQTEGTPLTTPDTPHVPPTSRCWLRHRQQLWP